jgi:hypothetical protein
VQLEVGRVLLEVARARLAVASAQLRTGEFEPRMSGRYLRTCECSWQTGGFGMALRTSFFVRPRRTLVSDVQKHVPPTV